MDGKKIVILCLGIFVCFINYSKSAEDKNMTCSGIVYDAQGQPVTDAKVEIRQLNPDTNNVDTAFVKTDKNGQYAYSNIKWPYTVGVARDQKISEAGGYKLQYFRPTEVYDSSEKLHFKLNAFPTGSASLSGRVTDQHGQPFQDFTIRIHKKVDWNDYTRKFLSDYGYLLPFSSSDGKFDIKDLPVGTYTVTVFHPQKWDRYEFPKLQEVTLEDDKTVEIKCEVFEKQAYYGRVLFSDGKPAYIDSPPWPGARTYVKLPSSRLGEIPAVIDKEGYFTAYLTNKEFEQLYNWESEIEIYYPSFENKGLFVDHGMFPVELLSNEKSKAGFIIKENRGPVIGIPAGHVLLRNRSLPDMKDFGINLSPADVNDKSMLVCFFDMEQRPSRNCILQLSKKAQELRAKDIVIVIIQASKVNRAKLEEWKSENNISFPIGVILFDGAHKRRIWGVRSYPWLILTNKEHVVTAEGFNIDELDEKITSLGVK